MFPFSKKAFVHQDQMEISNLICGEANMPETTQSDNLNGNADASLGFKYSQYPCCHFSVKDCKPR